MATKKPKGGRPTTANQGASVEFAATPIMIKLLDQLIELDGFGNSRAEIARNFTWKEINRLREGGLFAKRKD